MFVLNLSRVRITLIGIIFSLFSLGCSQSNLPLVDTPTLTPSSPSMPSSTPVPAFTPTIIPSHPLTLTPTITPIVAIISAPSVTPYQSSISTFVTPYPLSTCDGGESYTAKWTTEVNGMLLEAFSCANETLIAIFHNQFFSDPITINIDTWATREFAWEVGANVDSDKNTGWPRASIYGPTGEGVDYVLFIENWVTGKRETIPFSQAFQIGVWKCDSKSAQLFSGAELYADKTNKLIILRGKIPGLNGNSQLFFYRKHMADKNHSYITGILTSTAP